MMWRALLAAALLAVSACSSAPKSPEDACKDAVDQDPAVKEDLAKSSENLDWQWQNGAKMRADRQDALTRCLQTRGILRRGGVERQRQQ